MGKCKYASCPMEGCGYKARKDNMSRHVKSHENGTLKYSSVIFKPKPDHFELKQRRRTKSERAPQPTQPQLEKRYTRSMAMRDH